jgi:putative glutamine amidotransferase
MYHVTYINNFIVSAYSPDGLIEAIELPDKDFVLGVQWHPEKMVKYDVYANKIIDGFIEKCKNKELSHDRVY